LKKLLLIFSVPAKNNKVEGTPEEVQSSLLVYLKGALDAEELTINWERLPS
jgi:hypothetical protein